MATQFNTSLNKLARLKDEQKIQMNVLPLDPEFPFFIERFDPGFFGVVMSLSDDANHED